MQLHNLKKHSSEKTSQRVGRGGKRGKTSGKGTKGQKARAGRKLRPEIRDIIKKLPKRRGYRFKSIQQKSLPIDLATLENIFASGDTVPVQTLKARNIVPRKLGGNITVKILGGGDLSKKLTIRGLDVSASAKAKIEKAGGAVR